MLANAKQSVPSTNNMHSSQMHFWLEKMQEWSGKDGKPTNTRLWLVVTEQIGKP